MERLRAAGRHSTDGAYDGRTMAGEGGELRPRQLQMHRPHLEQLPAVVAPAGYRLRTYRHGDEVAWGEIMGSTEGIGTGWTVEQVQTRLIQRPQFEPAGLFFATCDAEAGRPVASACAWRDGEAETRSGMLHMVCALPAHRGGGLGRLVCLAVLHYLRAREYADVTLATDDFRLAAILSYLRLGFVPAYVADPASDHEVRWGAILGQLLGPGSAAPAAPPAPAASVR